jgi:LPS export ABC transporter protein LptC
MGVRIEWLIGVMIAIMLIVSYFFEAQQQKLKSITLDKDVEMHNSYTTEVNQSEIMSTLYSQDSVRFKNVTEMKKPIYGDRSVKRLTAKKGRLIGDILTLHGSVDMKDTRGNHFLTEQASYNKKSEFFKAPKEFTAHLTTGVVKGYGLDYYQKKQFMTAKQNQSIFAVQ